MANRDLRKKEDIENLDEDEEPPTPRMTQKDLPASAIVVHSSETEDAPQKEIHEAYTDENIEKLKENASPANEGEELSRESRRLKRSGSSGDEDSSAA